MNARYLPVLISDQLPVTSYQRLITGDFNPQLLPSANKRGSLTPKDNCTEKLVTDHCSLATENDVLLEPSLLSLSQPRESLALPLTDRGAPRKRKGGASHFATTGN